MKKVFFYMAAAAIALTSCSSEDVVEVNNGDEIGFRATMFGSTNTRGPVTTTDNLNSFFVTAYNGESMFFEDVLFQKTTTGYFLSNPVYYWPTNANLKLKFTALGYATDEGVVETNKLGDYTITADNVTIDFTPAADPKDQVDLVLATAEGTKPGDTDDPDIKLEFKHLLSRVLPYAYLSEESPYTFKIKAVKVCHLRNKSHFDNSITFVERYRDDRWDFPADAVYTDYRVDFEPITLTDEVQALYAPDEAAMFVPQSEMKQWSAIYKTYDAPHMKLLIQITNTKSGEIIYPVAEEDIAEGEGEEAYGWSTTGIMNHYMGGYGYKYVLDFAHGAGYDDNHNPILGGPIVFKEEVVDWKETEPTTVKFGTSTDDKYGEIENNVNSGKEDDETQEGE